MSGIQVLCIIYCPHIRDEHVVLQKLERVSCLVEDLIRQKE